MATVLVTGAGRNIGRHVAEVFAAEGHAVVINARDKAAVKSVVDAITRRGGRAVPLPGDVRDRAFWADAVRDLEASSLSADVVIHCAMVRVTGAFLTMRYEDWRTSLDVCLDGAFNAAQATLPGMVARGWGRIINIGGVSGQSGMAERAGVVTAKSGLFGLTRALAHEFAASGVTANIVSPGMIDTERGVHTSLGDVEAALARYERRLKEIPVGRMGRLDEIAAACRYLASEDAGFVTGQILNVNGGVYM